MKKPERPSNDALRAAADHLQKTSHLAFHAKHVADVALWLYAESEKKS